MPNLPTLYGAMLAGVGYILMGAGIRGRFPECWMVSRTTTWFRSSSTSKDLPRRGGVSASIRGALGSGLHFSAPIPRHHLRQLAGDDTREKGKWPRRRIRDRGSHRRRPQRAPAGELKLNERGEPIYGERDVVDLAKMLELGLPFWLAGGAGSPERLRRRARPALPGSRWARSSPTARSPA
jgi:hypothetical protein